MASGDTENRRKFSDLEIKTIHFFVCSMGIKLILATIFIAFWAHRFYEAGAFTTIHPHQNYPSCKKVNGVLGPEDIVILDSGIALISGNVIKF